MRPKAWVGIFCAATAAVAVVSQFGPLNAAVTLSALTCMLVSCFILICPSSCCRPPETGLAQPPGTLAILQTHVIDNSNRAAHLDALKVFLTAAVIVHHVVGAFAGNGLGLSVGVYRSSFQAFAIPFLSLQQSYFMSLFFFISALFAPASLSRKGPRAFLADKAKRLVLPLLAMFWVLYPSLMMFAVGVIAHNSEGAGYSPTPGPAWFLFWLALFHACFALAARDPQVGAMPPVPPVGVSGQAAVRPGLSPAHLVLGTTHAPPATAQTTPALSGTTREVPSATVVSHSADSHAHPAVPFASYALDEEERSELLTAPADDHLHVQLGGAGTGLAFTAPLAAQAVSARPALWQLFSAGLSLGFLQASEMIGLPAGLMMPISWGSLPFDVAFFVAGLAAARGRMLDHIDHPDTPLLSRNERIVVWGVVVTVAVACFAGGAACVWSDSGCAPVFPAQPCDAPVPAIEPGPGLLIAVIGFGGVFGVFAVCVSCALLDWFARNAAGPHPQWLRAAARASFAAYLVHPWVLIPVQWAFVAAVVPSGSGGWPLALPASGVPSSGACLNGPDSGSGALLWAGFAVTAAAAVPGSFVAGAALVRLPLLRDVL